MNGTRVGIVTYKLKSRLFFAINARTNGYFKTNVNTNTPISSFIRWAERRIAQEVELNESFKEESGEVIALKESTHLPHSLTNEQKLAYIEAVDALRDEGKGSLVACRKTGIHVSTYNQWRNKFGLGRYVK